MVTLPSLTAALVTDQDWGNTLLRELGDLILEESYHVLELPGIALYYEPQGVDKAHLNLVILTLRDDVLYKVPTLPTRDAVGSHVAHVLRRLRSPPTSGYLVGAACLRVHVEF